MTHRTMSALHRSAAPDAQTSTETSRTLLQEIAGPFGHVLNELRFSPALADQAVWLKPDDVARLRNQFRTTWFKSSALGHPQRVSALRRASTDLPRDRGDRPRPRSTGFSQLRSAS